MSVNRKRVEYEGSLYALVDEETLLVSSVLLYGSYAEALAAAQKLKGATRIVSLSVTDKDDVFENEHGIEFVRLFEDGDVTQLQAFNGTVGIPASAMRHFRRVRVK